LQFDQKSLCIVGVKEGVVSEGIIISKKKYFARRQYKTCLEGISGIDQIPHIHVLKGMQE
jgi:hypothetical protein